MKRLFYFPNSYYNDRVSLCLPHFTVAIVLLLGLLVQPGLGYFGGTGSIQAPFVIATAEDLIELGQSPRDYDKHFILANDIDLSGYAFDQAVIAPSQFSPFLAMDNGLDFSGTINGNGHVIRHLKVSGKSYLGLIGILGQSAQIYGLGVVDANVSGTGESVGILAGYSEGSIYNSYSSGVVNGQIRVGGLVGQSWAWREGTIQNSYSTAQVRGDTEIGGFVGENAFGEITNCYSTGMVKLNVVDPNALIAGFTPSRGGASHCFWDIQTSGIPDTRGLSEMIGLSTEQMQDINTFLAAGWDFLGENTNGNEDIWVMPEGGGYPVLSIFYGIEPKLPACCGATLGQCALSLDPNEVLWDSPTIFQPSWLSVTLSKIAKNPLVYPNLDPNEQDIVITVSGRIKTLDPTNLMGVDPLNGVVCQALDDEGRDVAFRGGLSPFEPRHCWTILDPSPNPFTVYLQLDPNQPIPTSLSELNFFVYALYAKPLAIIEIPFEPTDTWMELLPGFRIWIEKAVSEGYLCEYTIKEEITASSITSGSFFTTGTNVCDRLYPGDLEFNHDYSDDDVVYNFVALDSEGKPSTGSGSGSSSGSSRSPNGVRTQTRTLNWTNCSGIDVIRYTIAVDPYRVLVPLTLVDIPVNDF